MPWQKNGTPNTLAIAGSTLSVDDLIAEQNNVILSHNITDNLVPQGNIQFGSGTIDTGTNYCHRRSRNGASDVTAASTTNIGFETFTGANSSSFGFVYNVNLATQEKLTISQNVMASVTGAATAPNRQETIGKWVDTTNQFDNVQIINTNTGDFATDSNLSVLSDVVPIPETIGGWVELGRTTLGSAGDSIDVSGLVNKRYYMLLTSAIAAGNMQLANCQLNGDSTSNYAWRISTNGGADSTATSTVGLITGTAQTTTPQLAVSYLANLASVDKLCISHGVGQNTAGAGTAPVRRESVGKWAVTSNSINRINQTNDGTGSYDTGSELIVLGWDPSDVHTTNFWEELATDSGSGATLDTGTFTAKKYLWLQCYCKPSSSTNLVATFNSDTASNYAIRESVDGGADSTNTSLTNTDNLTGTSSGGLYFNMFIINIAGQEKIWISHGQENTAGAGTAGNRKEMVGKWANTVDAITKITCTANFGANSELRLWGSD